MCAVRVQVLSAEVASYLGLELGKIKIKRFADGEIYVQVQVRSAAASAHSAHAQQQCRNGSQLHMRGHDQRQGRPWVHSLPLHIHRHAQQQCCQSMHTESKCMLVSCRNQ